MQQWAGVSPVPDELRGKSSARHVYGDGISFLMIPADDDTVMWAYVYSDRQSWQKRLIVLHRTGMIEPEAKETWKALDETSANAFKKSYFGDWEFGVAEAVRNSTQVIKVYIDP